MHKQPGWMKEWMMPLHSALCIVVHPKLFTIMWVGGGGGLSSTTTSDPKLENTVKQSRNIIRSILPGLRRQITGLLLSGPKSSFQMKVDLAFHLEIKVPGSGERVEAPNPSCLKSSVKFPQSVMIWAAVSSAGVGPLCFQRYKVNAAIYQEILEHFMLPSADKLYGDADFIFKQDLAPAYTAKGTKSWFNDHGVTVLDWPANSSDLNLIENLWGIVKRKMRNTRPNNTDDLKATIKAARASITPEQCHRLIDSMPRRIDAVIQAKGVPTKYWVHRNNILFRSLTFLFKISFFNWSYVIFKFSKTLNFEFSLSVSHNHKNSRNKGLKYLTLCVINLYNIWVSLSEISDQKYWPLSWYSHFLKCICMAAKVYISLMASHGELLKRMYNKY